jgi:hypothetical protein
MKKKRTDMIARGSAYGIFSQIRARQNMKRRDSIEPKINSAGDDSPPALYSTRIICMSAIVQNTIAKSPGFPRIFLILSVEVRTRLVICFSSAIKA